MSSRLRRKMQWEDCTVFLAFLAPGNVEAVKVTEPLLVDDEGDCSLGTQTDRSPVLSRKAPAHTEGGPSPLPPV